MHMCEYGGGPRRQYGLSKKQQIQTPSSTTARAPLRLEKYRQNRDNFRKFTKKFSLFLTPNHGPFLFNLSQATGYVEAFLEDISEEAEKKDK